MGKIFRVVLFYFVSIGLIECQNFDDQLKFEYFYGTATFPQIRVYDIRTLESLVNYEGFRSNAPTVIFHFDAGETAREQHVVEVITSYLYAGRFNVIVIDYTDVGVISDGTAESLAQSITRGLEGFIKHYNPDLVHLLGNGVGANVLSRTAENLGRNGLFVGRLTGLNPTRISHSALFTDTIHTEESNFNPQYVGQAAFYVNNGTHPQPRCLSLPSCSKDFSKRVWAESARQVGSFPTMNCGSWDEFLNNECNQNQPVGNMGVYAQDSLRGSFFVQTNTREPWSRNTPFPGEPDE